MDPLPDLRQRKSVGDAVYEALKQSIINLGFAPGQRLLLADLEERMGVSRTPLREALAKLAAEGLVETRTHRGTFVTNPTPDEILQKCDVRRVLETYALELAAQRMTAEQLSEVRSMVQEMRRLVSADASASTYVRYLGLDHKMLRLLMDVAGNLPLKRLWQQVNLHPQVMRALHEEFGDGPLSEAEKKELRGSQEEHEDILGALEDKDLPALRQAMYMHIERSKRWATVGAMASPKRESGG